MTQVRDCEAAQSQGEFTGGAEPDQHWDQPFGVQFWRLIRALLGLPRLGSGALAEACFCHFMLQMQHFALV